MPTVPDPGGGGEKHEICAVLFLQGQGDHGPVAPSATGLITGLNPNLYISWPHRSTTTGCFVPKSTLITLSCVSKS